MTRCLATWESWPWHCSSAISQLFVGGGVIFFISVRCFLLVFYQVFGFVVLDMVMVRGWDG